jgi:methanogenic corrinoid protein MtbC1
MESVMSEEKNICSTILLTPSSNGRRAHRQLAQEVVARRIDAYQAIDLALPPGWNGLPALRGRGVFYPELLICSDAMYAGWRSSDRICGWRPAEDQGGHRRGRGDTHDIGKNLVKIPLEVAVSGR